MSSQSRSFNEPSLNNEIHNLLTNMQRTLTELGKDLKRDIDKLRREVKDLKQGQEELNNDMAVLKDGQDEMKNEIDEVKGELNSFQEELKSEIQEKHDELKQDVEEIKEKIENIQEKLESELKEVQEEIMREIKDSQTILIDGQDEMKNEIDEVKEELSSFQEELKTEMEDIQNDVKRIPEILESEIRKAKEDLTDEIEAIEIRDDLKNEVRPGNYNLGKLKNVSSQLKGGNFDIKKDLSEMNLTIKLLQIDIESLKNRLTDHPIGSRNTTLSSYTNPFDAKNQDLKFKANSADESENAKLREQFSALKVADIKVQTVSDKPALIGNTLLKRVQADAPNGMEVVMDNTDDY